MFPVKAVMPSFVPLFAGNDLSSLHGDEQIVMGAPKVGTDGLTIIGYSRYFHRIISSSVRFTCHSPVHTFTVSLMAAGVGMLFWLGWQSAGFTALMANAQEDEAAVRAFIEVNGFTFPILLDSPGELMRLYGVRGLPTTFVIDRNGQVAIPKPGPSPWSSWKRLSILC